MFFFFLEINGQKKLAKNLRFVIFFELDNKSKNKFSSFFLKRKSNKEGVPKPQKHIPEKLLISNPQRCFYSPLFAPFFRRNSPPALKSATMATVMQKIKDIEDEVHTIYCFFSSIYQKKILLFRKNRLTE